MTPRFDRSLGIRGLMPAEFFGTMFYSPDREHSPYDFLVRTNPDSRGFSGHLDPRAVTSIRTTTGSH